MILDVGADALQRVGGRSRQKRMEGYFILTYFDRRLLTLPSKVFLIRSFGHPVLWAKPVRAPLQDRAQHAEVEGRRRE